VVVRFVRSVKLPLTRRRFLSQTTTLSLAAWLGPRVFARGKSPNERLNLGIIGTANRARANIDGVKGENIVALCDIDENYLNKASNDFPSAQIFHDFRELLAVPELEAVVVSTADHTHAVATAAALRRGLHVYCEKPLTHSVHEARVIAGLAKESGKATQMGTQIHAGANYRRVVELIQGGAIGAVSECHVFCSKTWSGGERPSETPEVPKNLSWDLWLGPAPERPYHPTYLPANWRRWWDFGGGTIGDMGCHYLDLAHWALGLRHPLTVAAEGPPVHAETTPKWIVVTWEHPARDTMPPVTVKWYDGGKRPAELLADAGIPEKKDGLLFIGEKGMLFADYEARLLLPADKFTDFAAPAPTIPNSIGHYAEWFKACREGTPTTCNFDYSGALTEAVLLGNVAFRTGKKLDWDGAAARVTNAPEAAAFVEREYRKGWTL
jgi:predicted dehydrogenase